MPEKELDMELVAKRHNRNTSNVPVTEAATRERKTADDTELAVYDSDDRKVVTMKKS